MTVNDRKEATRATVRLSPRFPKPQARGGDNMTRIGGTHSCSMSARAQQPTAVVASRSMTKSPQPSLWPRSTSPSPIGNVPTPNNGWPAPSMTLSPPPRIPDSWHCRSAPSANRVAPGRAPRAQNIVAQPNGDPLATGNELTIASDGIIVDMLDNRATESLLRSSDRRTSSARA